MVKVLIAENHAVIRNGIERLLADDPRIDLLGAASKCSEAIVKAHKI